MYFIGLHCSTYHSSTNGPHGFICNHNILHLLLGHASQVLLDLCFADFLGDVHIEFFLRFTYAQDWLHTGFKHFSDSGVDAFVTVLEKGTALGVPAKNVFATDGFHHTRRDSTSKGSRLLVINTLGPNSNPGILYHILYLTNKRKRREQHDLGTHVEIIIDWAGFLSQKCGKISSELDCVFLSGWVHFPVACHDGLASMEGGEAEG
mmetsp:Transcript_14480/g.21349  ORF Transcript_14480/g.21349 Transcript_14480/m.21349 type:complete len:206 (+) Transcript_14480:314-931(+)